MVDYHKDHSVSEGFITEKIISNYIYSYSIKDKKVIDNLKGNTGSFIIFLARSFGNKYSRQHFRTFFQF